MSANGDLIMVEYAGPASRQVGTLPWYDVRAWWTVRDEGTTGRMKLAAGRELKKHIQADHVEYVNMDMDTSTSPRINALVTFRVLTHAQFTARAELRTRRYTQCDREAVCHAGYAGQLVEHTDGSGKQEALCYGCWKPLADEGAVKVLHWITGQGKIQI